MKANMERKYLWQKVPVMLEEKPKKKLVWIYSIYLEYSIGYVRNKIVWKEWIYWLGSPSQGKIAGGGINPLKQLPPNTRFYLPEY